LGAQVHHARALATRRCSRHPDTPAAPGGHRNKLGLVPGDEAPGLLALEAAGMARGPSERSSRTWRESFHPLRPLPTSDSPGHQTEACKTSLPRALCKISPRFGELARSDARHSSSGSAFLGGFLRPPRSAKKFETSVAASDFPSERLCQLRAARRQRSRNGSTTAGRTQTRRPPISLGAGASCPRNPLGIYVYIPRGLRSLQKLRANRIPGAPWAPERKFRALFRIFEPLGLGPFAEIRARSFCGESRVGLCH